MFLWFFWFLSTCGMKPFTLRFPLFSSPGNSVEIVLTPTNHIVLYTPLLERILLLPLPSRTEEISMAQ